MNNRALLFRNNFLKAFEASPFSSLRALSLSSGISASRAQKIASGDFDNSEVGPGIFLIEKICEQLGCTPNDLLGYQSHEPTKNKMHRTGEPSIEKLVTCHVRSSGHISGFSEYLNFCQIYDEPKDGAIKLVSNGQLSLATRVTEETNIGFLQGSFFKFSEETRDQVYQGQRLAWEKGMGLDAVFLNHDIPEKGKRARFDFLRAAFRVRMADSSEKLLVYCTMVEQTIS